MKFYTKSYKILDIEIVEKIQKIHNIFVWKSYGGIYRILCVEDLNHFTQNRGHFFRDDHWDHEQEKWNEKRWKKACLQSHLRDIRAQNIDFCIIRSICAACMSTIAHRTPAIFSEMIIGIMSKKHGMRNDGKKHVFNLI